MKESPKRKVRIQLLEELVGEAIKVAPRSMRRNPSRIIERALRFWIDARKEHQIDRDIARMGKDPQVIAECGKINKEFEQCDADGL